VSQTFLIYSLSILSFDQLLKLVSSRYLTDQLVFNQGIIFGWEFSYSHWLAILILCLILIWSLKTSPGDQRGLGLIFGGGLSNLLDRLLKGGVVDFNFFSFSAFNVADLAIMVGVFWLILPLLFPKYFKID
jgi:signal peptidase II